MVWYRRRHHQGELPRSDEALFATLTEVLKTQRIIMADLTNLQAAVAANTQAVTDVEAEVASLKAITGTDQATIDAITKQISDNNTALEALKPPVSPA